MQVGLICSIHGNVTIDKCATCRVPCHPYPALVAILEGARTPVLGSYSVTELPKPYKSVYLSRNFDYYVKPENLLPTTLGTSWHEKVEKYGNERFLMEKSFKTKIDGLTFTGRCDIIDTKLKILWDLKTSAFYPIGLMLDGNWTESTFPYQVNTYRHFIYPDAKEMWLDVSIRDWKKWIAKKYGISRWIKIQIPFIPMEDTTAYVTERIIKHAEIQESCAGVLGKLPDCTKEEMWMKEDGPVFCKDYCGGAAHCDQFKQWKKDSEYRDGA